MILPSGVRMAWMALIGQLLAEDHWPRLPGPAVAPACSSVALGLGPSPRSIGAGTSRSRARSRSMSRRLRTVRRILPGLAVASLPVVPASLPLPAGGAVALSGDVPVL